jgi:hypothetical protein
LTKVNVPNLYKHINPEQHWKAIVVNNEALVREIYPAASKQAGKCISTSLCIVDLKGFGLRGLRSSSYCSTDASNATSKQIEPILADVKSGEDVIPDVPRLLPGDVSSIPYRLSINYSQCAEWER